ncbi:ribosome maturation factor RimM [Microvirga sp. 17 mud 1-3]|uniref:ribosome maturation factor RimM n=1 Tax=Microvirga sp. 17 mud 1-3 TaxID=2082949 RepID=UPI000D6D6D66|nr:ribosome maturation factor RimM [Microvirga sp. 17 mud 1-3]
MTKKERFNQRSTSPLPPVGRGRGGGASANRSKGALTPPPPPPPHKGEESRSAPARDDLVLVGEFGRAHGLKGEVRLKSFTGDPAAIAGYGPLLTAQGRSISIEKVRPVGGGAPDMLIAQVKGVTSREAAEALNRVPLFVERAKLPPPEEEDEFLLADLIGLDVVDEAGAQIGTVVDVPNYGGGDLLDIRSAGTGATALLPFTKAFVPAVDIPGRRIVAALPEDFFAPARPEPKDEA